MNGIKFVLLPTKTPRAGSFLQVSMNICRQVPSMDINVKWQLICDSKFSGIKMLNGLDLNAYNEQSMFYFMEGLLWSCPGNFVKA